jgi:para-aminobenzoate synthetase component 1
VSKSARIRLDSSHPAEDRWPCASAEPTRIVRCDSLSRGATLLDSSGNVLKTWSNPLEALGWIEHDVKERNRPHSARWVGYLSYDLGRLFEQLPARAIDDLAIPLFVFGLIEDHHDVSDAASLEGSAFAGLRSTFSRDAYFAAVERCIDYIRAGDVFQINLSQRFTTTLPDSPERIYDRLLATAPAWYGGLLDFGDHALICNSPELFLRIRPDAATGERKIITRPIKGTRPRQPGMSEQLLHSAKDQAELNMIVDLERNDLGRICRTGSVKVPEPRTIESHPTVYHGAATVEGVLRDDVGFVDLLRAVFPGGSVTGAPKIRAMEIIDELEPVRRGPYCGAIGYLAVDGRIEFNVAIRTMIVKDRLVHIPVGGGIVADSDPAAEYEETLVKARAMFAALGLSPASTAAFPSVGRIPTIP